MRAHILAAAVGAVLAVSSAVACSSGDYLDGNSPSMSDSPGAYDKLKSALPRSTEEAGAQARFHKDLAKKGFGFAVPQTAGVPKGTLQAKGMVSKGVIATFERPLNQSGTGFTLTFLAKNGKAVTGDYPKDSPDLLGLLAWGQLNRKF